MFFESIVEKVIAGGYDDEGNADPSMITFVYKTGFEAVCLLGYEKMTAGKGT